ncbi:solute carrier family 28 member 3-like [Mya arenaria]|uniref:solute carrier family 28 member 3-like n=1 Tax=Mya arenaria TaxID=6604 RepID=UPI0022E84D16|nr:solute carrier family 28 member 3-like [Mya arenaria]
MKKFLLQNKEIVTSLRNYALLVLFLMYYGYAMYCHFGDEPSVRLTVFTCLGVWLIFWRKIKLNEFVQNGIRGILAIVHAAYHSGQRPRIIRWFLYILNAGVLLTYLVIEVILAEPRKLISLGGFLAFLLLLFLMSNNKRQINWHCIFWGCCIQCYIGYFILKSSSGRYLVNWFAARLEEFMQYSDVGAEYVFGPKFLDHPFAFQTVPAIIVFCAVIQVLIYLGTIQFIVKSLGKVLAVVLDVSAPEAVNACANIFLGGIESALLVVEYIEGMPTSHLFALMTNWFASCGGSALIKFAQFGVPASHLLSASAMSAPAALVCAKLMFPDCDKELNEALKEEVEVDVSLDSTKSIVDDNPKLSLDTIKVNGNVPVPKFCNNNTNEHVLELKVDTTESLAHHDDDINGSVKQEETESQSEKSAPISTSTNAETKMKPTKKSIQTGDNMLEALVIGTKAGVKLTASIVANMIVFLSVIEMADKTVEWFANRVDLHLTFSIILSYAFYPLVFLMGISVSDCFKAAELLGLRTLANAGVSYLKLGQIVDNNDVLTRYELQYNTTWFYVEDDIFLKHENRTLTGGVMSERSVIILTFALCGFASVGLLGMLVGAMSSLIPSRTTELSKLTVRVLITGTLASYLTACVAGLMV